MTDVLELSTSKEQPGNALWGTSQMVQSVEGRVVRHADRPISFETFLILSESVNPDMELINGVMVETMSAQLTHEKLFAWLYVMMRLYTQRRNLGVVLGSRTPVEITAYSGRMPDLLFVRQERIGIVQERAVYGPPDLVIEIVSPNDRPSDLIAVEADYRTLGVEEIVFVDMLKQQVRVVRRREAEYMEQNLREGIWQPLSLPGFRIEVAWLLREPRPDELDTLQSLLAGST